MHPIFKAELEAILNEPNDSQLTRDFFLRIKGYYRYKGLLGAFEVRLGHVLPFIVGTS